MSGVASIPQNPAGVTEDARRASRLSPPAGSLTANSRPRATARFTLVELLVVIGIIAVLAALLMPALAAARRSVREGAIKTEIKSMELAMTQYHQDWGQYPPDMTEDGQYYDGDGGDMGRMKSAQSLVYFLGTKFRVSANSDDEVQATKNGGPYFNFKSTRLTRDADGDGSSEFTSEVYLDQFGTREGISFYRFDNNDDDGGSESWESNYNAEFDGWNVSNVHPTKVDIWSAGEDGQDEVLDEHPTKDNLDTVDLGDDLGNW